jgi:protein-L-isoaspartate(D-aspartate) O-methyltransferase
VEDSYKHQGLRSGLINELRSEGAFNEETLAAMSKVPRHFFLDSALAELAYENKALPIGLNQTISHPSTVAAQTTLLKVKKGDKVLEIGTGCGYQTAVLAQYGAEVYSIERLKELHLKAKRVLNALRLRAHLSFGDGFKGFPRLAPFDGIVVTCGASFVPEELLKQLAVGGIMIIPVGENYGSQTMKRITRIAPNEFQEENFGEFKFVPMLEKRQ